MSSCDAQIKRSRLAPQFIEARMGPDISRHAGCRFAVTEYLLKTGAHYSVQVTPMRECLKDIPETWRPDAQRWRFARRRLPSSANANANASRPRSCNQFAAIDSSACSWMRLNRSCPSNGVRQVIGLE